MAGLNDFIALVKNEGLARPNFFDVELTLPILVQKFYNNSGFDVSNILMYAESTNLPAINMSTTQVRTFGELREVPYDKLFDNVVMTFYVDQSLQVKNMFDAWIDSIQDPESRTFNYYDQYVTDMAINVLDRQNANRYTVRLYECYPKAVGAVELNMNSKDVMRLQVILNYKYIRRINFGVPSGNDGFTGSFELDNREVPKDYFNDFGGFQKKYKTFTDQTADFNTQDTLGRITNSSSIGQVPTQVSNPPPLNTPALGDDFGFDFI